VANCVTPAPGTGDGAITVGAYRRSAVTTRVRTPAPGAPRRACCRVRTFGDSQERRPPGAREPGREPATPAPCSHSTSRRGDHVRSPRLCRPGCWEALPHGEVETDHLCSHYGHDGACAVQFRPGDPGDPRMRADPLSVVELAADVRRVEASRFRSRRARNRSRQQLAASLDEFGAPSSPVTASNIQSCSIPAPSPTRFSWLSFGPVTYPAFFLLQNCDTVESVHTVRATARTVATTRSCCTPWRHRCRTCILTPRPTRRC
jgi:hypothetical protein